jgi:hypothetical protein
LWVGSLERLKCVQYQYASAKVDVPYESWFQDHTSGLVLTTVRSRHTTTPEPINVVSKLPGAEAKCFHPGQKYESARRKLRTISRKPPPPQKTLREITEDWGVR